MVYGAYAEPDASLPQRQNGGKGGGVTTYKAFTMALCSLTDWNLANYGIKVMDIAT